MEKKENKQNNLKRDIKQLYAGATNKLYKSPRIRKIKESIANKELKGMVLLTGGIGVAALGFGSLLILKASLLGIGSVYLITKGAGMLVRGTGNKFRRVK